MIARFMGLRFLFVRSSENFLSPVTIASLLGITVGVTILTIVNSVMNGFDFELKNRLLGVIPHVYVEQTEPKKTSILIKDLENEVIGLVPFISVEGMLLLQGENRFLEFHGVSEEYEPLGTKISEAIRSQPRETYKNKGAGILLSDAVAKRYSLNRGSDLNLLFPKVSARGENIRPRMFAGHLAGTFSFRSELDHYLALVDVSELADMSGRKMGTKIYLNNIFYADEVSDLLNKNELNAQSWTKKFGDLFKAVKMEKSLMFVLMLLVIAISSAGIVSALAILIQDKQVDIGILRTMGMEPLEITKIFLLFGVTVSGFATVFGLVFGVLISLIVPDFLAWVSLVFGFSIIEGTYFSRIPVDIRLLDLILIGSASVSISFIAALKPALRAASLYPVIALRSR